MSGNSRGAGAFNPAAAAFGNALRCISERLCRRRRAAYRSKPILRIGGQRIHYLRIQGVFQQFNHF